MFVSGNECHSSVGWFNELAEDTKTFTVILPQLDLYLTIITFPGYLEGKSDVVLLLKIKKETKEQELK